MRTILPLSDSEIFFVKLARSLRSDAEEVLGATRSLYFITNQDHMEANVSKLSNLLLCAGLALSPIALSSTTSNANPLSELLSQPRLSSSLDFSLESLRPQRLATLPLLLNELELTHLNLSDL